MRDCYACGEPIPILEMENGYNLKCRKCGSETTPQLTLEEAEEKWNEGIIFTGEKFYSMVLGKARQMSKVSNIRDFCGDYAFDVEYSEDNIFTMFFNSRRNAETVKRCIEVDDSVPNVATAVDFVEVVRCKDCINAKPYERADGETGYYCQNNNSTFRYGTNWERLYEPTREANDYCSYGERREG